MKTFDKALAGIAGTLLLFGIATLGAPDYAVAADADITAAVEQGDKNIFCGDMGIELGDDIGELELIKTVFRASPCASTSSDFMGSRSKGTVQYVIPYYDCSLAQLKEREAQYWEEVRSIVSACPADDDAERALWLFKRVIDRVEYAYDAVGDVPDEVYHRWSTPAAALLEGKASCGGYARLLADLLVKAGIPALAEADGKHAWTIAKIGDEWLTLDATYDDASEALTHFLIGDDGRTRYVVPEGAASVEEDGEIVPAFEKKLVSYHIGYRQLRSWKYRSHADETIYSLLATGERKYLPEAESIFLYRWQIL